MVRRKNTLPKGSFLHRRSLIHTDFSHIAHKRRNTRFNGLWRVHTPKHGAFRTGALLLPSEHFACCRNSRPPLVKTANFAAFGPWSGALPKNVESLRNSDALMRVAVPRRRGPAGLRDPIAFSLTALIGFAVLVDRDYRVRKKAHFVFMHRAALPALPAPSAALLYALMH